MALVRVLTAAEASSIDLEACLKAADKMLEPHNPIYFRVKPRSIRFCILIYQPAFYTPDRGNLEGRVREGLPGTDREGDATVSRRDLTYTTAEERAASAV